MICANIFGQNFSDRSIPATYLAIPFFGYKSYHSKVNEDFIDKEGFVSKVHRKKPRPNP